MRARHARVSSTADSSPEPSCEDISSMVRWVGSIQVTPGKASLPERVAVLLEDLRNGEAGAHIRWRVGHGHLRSERRLDPILAQHALAKRSMAGGLDLARVQRVELLHGVQNRRELLLVPELLLGGQRQPRQLRDVSNLLQRELHRYFRLNQLRTASMIGWASSSFFTNCPNSPESNQMPWQLKQVSISTGPCRIVCSFIPHLGQCR